MNHLKGIKERKIRAQQLGKSGIRSVMGLFLAQRCPVCDRPTAQTFCTDCQRQIYQPRPAAYHPLPNRRRTENPSSSTSSLPVIALGAYSGSLKQAILAMKYGDRPDVARPLGAALAQHWLTHGSTQLPAPWHNPPNKPLVACQNSAKTKNRPISTRSLYVVPIPLHSERQKSRGFNQAELIARAFCQASRLPLLADGLVRLQATQPQHALGLAERQQNLSEVFQVGTSLQKLIAHNHKQPSQPPSQPLNRHLSQASVNQLHSQLNQPTTAVLLIDDIYTTGATAQSAATTLSQAGIPVVGIAAVAQAFL